MMKKLFFLAAIVTAFTGCKKYDEGPALSLRSKEARVANTWKVEKYTYNGTDYTTSLAGYTETYSKDGAYSFQYTSGSTTVTGNGRWDWQNDKEDIKRSGVSSQSTETLHILKLKEDSFWFTITDGNDTDEYHLVPN